MDKGRQRKTGLAGKKHWFEKKVLKKPSSDVVLTQNEKGTSTVQSTEQCNTSVDHSPNQFKPLASEGSDYSRLLGENERQQMKQIKAQHVDTLDTVSLVFFTQNGNNYIYKRITSKWSRVVTLQCQIIALTQYGTVTLKPCPVH